MSDILALIGDADGNFSKSQRRIADYIMNNAETAAYLTAAKLAAKTGVSEATVVRFASCLGFEGYPEFQKSLKEFAKTQLTSVQRMEIAYERIGDEALPDRLMKSDIAYIERTLENIDKAQFKKAVEAISAADNIYITGVRSAGALAEFAGFYLHLIFDNVRLVKATGGDDMFERIINISDKDVLIGISFPRYSKNTIKALEYAQKNGAAVIGITDSSRSPLVEKSDYCLIAESEATSFVDSLTAPFSLINALIVAVGMKNRNKMQTKLERLETIWDEYGVYDKND